MGRTQLQDAVPMTLGQEFATYAVMIEEDRQRLAEAAALLLEINLGGTAIGTGINGHPRYAALRLRAPRARSPANPSVPAGDLVEATQDCGAFVQLSGVLKRVAVKLSKICNDLRLISSGPTTGLGEINLPPVQAGSSIMPGKVNPVIPEVVNQVAFEVIGNDLTVTHGRRSGPAPAQRLRTRSSPTACCAPLTHLHAACDTLADPLRLRHHRQPRPPARQRPPTPSAGHRTRPYIGYAASTTLARQALATGRPVKDLAAEAGLLTPEQLDTLLHPENLTGQTPRPTAATS